jgi:hypothetical protein
VDPWRAQSRRDDRCPVGIVTAAIASAVTWVVIVFVRPVRRLYNGSLQRRGAELLAIAGTGYGLIGLLVIILLIVLIVYFVRRA